MERQLFQGSDSSEDSNSNCFEFRRNTKPMPHTPSPLTKNQAYDDDISATETMLRRRKQPKKATPLLASSSSSVAAASKMKWTKNDELLILKGIVKYQNETDSSYTQNWDAFYGHLRESIELDFSKNQLINKVKKLKMRFKDNQARANDDGKQQVSFSNTHDEQVFSLSMMIWDEKETEFSYEESKDQKKEVDNGEPEKVEEDGVDLILLQDALEVAATFQSLSEKQRKCLLRGLNNIRDNKRKELTDEWKALLVEDMELNINKQSFFGKLCREMANERPSSQVVQYLQGPLSA